jgi:hypothetical protein
MVTPFLFKKYTNADAFARAKPVTFESEIRSTGFFRSKTKSILGACRAIAAKNCGPGEAGDSGCHYTVTSFRLSMHAAVACNGNVPTGAIPSEARGNYTAAQARMRRDAESSPLLLRPLQKLEHPRKIFDTGDDAATVIRLWSKQVTTQ